MISFHTGCFVVYLQQFQYSAVCRKSGGNIVIQHTEALTVIDVNTSKSIKIKGDSTKTFLKINKEAAKEIAYHLSLRNIGGIIIIDFII